MVENSFMDLLTSASVAGAISILSAIAGAIAGVGWATRKGSVEKRAKLETKERIKIESTKEMIQAIRDFYPVINSIKAQVIIFSRSVYDNLLSREKFEKGESEYIFTVGAESRINVEIKFKEIEDLIFLLECDLKINGENRILKSEMGKIKNILQEIKKFLEIEKSNDKVESIRKECDRIFERYSAENDEINREVMDICDKLTDVYIKRLS